MVCCSAVNCSNRSEKGNRLFRFPRNDRRAKWVQNMRRGDNWSPTDSSHLCQIHFEDSQFESHRLDRWRKLKPNAIPTVFCFNVPNPQPMFDPPKRKSLYKNSIKDVNIESQIVEPPNLPIVQDVLHVPQIEYKTTKAMARKRRRTQQNSYDGTCKTTKYVVNNTEPQNDQPGPSEKTNDGIRTEPQNNQPVKSAGSESATKKPGVAFLDTVKCEQRCVHYPDIPPTLFPYNQEPLPPVLTQYDQETLQPVLTSYDQERLPTRILILRDD